MSTRSFVLVLSAVLVFATGCNGPFVLLPGGALEGERAATPDDWSFAGDYGTGQLETNPGDPYSVNLVYTVVDGQLYLNAGDTETRWVKHMTANPEVRLRIDGRLYDLRAQRVTDAGTIEAFAKAWTAQSMFRNDPTELGEVWVYRLTAR